MNEFDVIVAGGGSAGLAAALSASREGAKTLLIERHAALGGAGSNAMVHTFCGLFHPDVAQGPQWLNPGIPTEIGELLLTIGLPSTPELMGRVYVIRHEPAVLARLAQELCQQESRLTVRTQAELTCAERNAGEWLLTINGEKMAAHAIVDTTGDAAIARSLDKELWQTAPGDRLYRPAYVFSIPGVATVFDDATRLQVAALLVRAVKAGALPQAALGATFRSSPAGDAVFISMDLEAGGAEWDPLDAAKVSTLESEGMDAAQALWRFLRDRHPAFATSSHPLLPVHAGIRESARWHGDYLLTAEDLLTSRRFEDEVALAGWPLEMRETARGPKFRYFNEPFPAGIPARCLRNASVPGLFFAGRCLSSDHEALASVRVMGTCLATGQAAGKLAAQVTG